MLFGEYIHDLTGYFFAKDTTFRYLLQKITQRHRLSSWVHIFEPKDVGIFNILFVSFFVTVLPEQRLQNFT